MDSANTNQGQIYQDWVNKKGHMLNHYADIGPFYLVPLVWAICMAQHSVEKFIKHNGENFMLAELCQQ